MSRTFVTIQIRDDNGVIAETYVEVKPITDANGKVSFSDLMDTLQNIATAVDKASKILN